MGDPKLDVTQNIPIRLTAILIASVSGSVDTQRLLDGLGVALLDSLRSVPFVASVQTIDVREVLIPEASRRTQ